MTVHEIRELLKTKSIFDIPLRVTYYARVSSESDEQLNSLDNQISYYEDLIRSRPQWTFVPGYIDEGLSGISTKKRESFNRMVSDASKDLFDFVLTKEISRFARNTLDSIQYTRQLLNYGVGVLFQNDSINTFDEDSELRLAIMSSIAQDELRKLSSRVKFGHQQAIKSGVVLGNSRIFGYNKDCGKLVIDEEQAVMVKELFELYASGEYSMKQLEKYFWDKGYRNNNGNKIAHSTMSNMISNPKYKGYYTGNKVSVVDMFTKKQNFHDPEEWVIYKDESGETVPAIVSESLWERANEVLRTRSEDVKNRRGICNHENLFTGKLFCTHCGTAYYRKETKDKHGNVNSRWVCSGKIKNGKDSCPSFAIYEDEIKPVLLDVMKEVEVNSDALIEELMYIYEAASSITDTEKQISDLNKRLDIIQKKKAKLLEYNISGQMTDSDFLRMNSQCEAEMAGVLEKLDELNQQLLSQDELNEQLKEIRAKLQEIKDDIRCDIISRNFVNRYIDRIYITPVDAQTAQLDIQIFTGESTVKYLEKLKRRAGHITTPSAPSSKNPDISTVSEEIVPTGHTFKKMTTIRTKSVTRRNRNSSGHQLTITYISTISLYPPLT